MSKYKDFFLSLLFYGIIGYINEFITLNLYNPLYNNPPLIDLGFRYIPEMNVNYSTYSLLGIIIYFFIKFRKNVRIINKAFTLIGILFIIRIFAFTFTLVPPTSSHCDVRKPGDPIRWNVLKRLFTDKDTACSDYMFSGHAIHIVILSLYIYKYASSKLEKKIVVYNSILSLLFIIGGRIHYTTDVIIAILVGVQGFLIQIYVNRKRKRLN